MTPDRLSITARPDPVQQAMAAGNAAWQAGRIDEAVRHFSKAALMAPDNASAHGNLGVSLRRQGKVEAAAVSCRRALALTPDDPALLSNLGNALRELGHHGPSVAALRRAVALRPGSASFRYNLALALRDGRWMNEAARMLEDLHHDFPESGDYQWDLALTRLYQCDYVRGFDGYEARWKLARTPVRDFPGPRWDGGDVAGKTVFLHAEQGFGDAIQFARFVPLLAARGAKVALECLPELRDLLAGLPGVVQITSKFDPAPPYDLWAPMLSLPRLLGCGWDDFPTGCPYLHAPPGPARLLATPRGARLKVGLVWAGKTTPRDRSWPLEKLLPLFEDPRIAWYSLQMGPRVADLAECGAGALVRDLSGHLNSFADTARVMEQMDLVVTIDTSAAHLAAALGRPTWILLRYVSDWRWLDEPEACRWYPTARLFRQPTPFDFDQPVAQIKAALAERLQAAAAEA